MRVAAAAVLGVLFLASCATTSASSSAGQRSQRGIGLITADEIAEQNGVGNALELITRLRPNFLRSVRTGLNEPFDGPVVRIDGRVLGGPDELKAIAISTIHEIRYYSAVEAEVRFGGDFNRPVIAVTTKQLR